MVASMLAAVVGAVVAGILAALSSPKDADTSDERDAAVNRRGDGVGFYVLSVGMLGPLGLTVAESAHFWIGNAMYLVFVAASLVSTAVKLISYRRGFQPW